MRAAGCRGHNSPAATNFNKSSSSTQTMNPNINGLPMNVSALQGGVFHLLFKVLRAYNSRTLEAVKEGIGPYMDPSARLNH